MKEKKKKKASDAKGGERTLGIKGFHVSNTVKKGLVKEVRELLSGRKKNRYGRVVFHNLCKVGGSL